MSDNERQALIEAAQVRTNRFFKTQTAPVEAPRGADAPKPAHPPSWTAEALLARIAHIGRLRDWIEQMEQPPVEDGQADQVAGAEHLALLEEYESLCNVPPYMPPEELEHL